MLRIGLLSLCLAAPASAQYAYTFTSGSPPIGDGTQYPRSLNPARASGNGGASPTTYFGAAGMGFVNLNGNPAFFDANNLLTRPSVLINGEAFWTDPKIGTFPREGGGFFDIAMMGLNVSAIDDADFGFDLAIASVSGPVTPVIQFQVQDSASHVAIGYLSFEDTGTSDPFYFSATQAGQFFSLSSPHPAYEGRFLLSNAALKDMIVAQNPTATGTDEIWFFDMSLMPFATNGGTTQIAMDNVVYGGNTPPDPRDEPSYLPPLGPIGANITNTIVYGEVENPSGDVYTVDPSALPDDLSTVSVSVGRNASDEIGALGAGSFAAGASIYFEAGPDAEIVAHEVAHVQQSRATYTVPADHQPTGEATAVTAVVAPPAPRSRLVSEMSLSEAAPAALAATLTTPQVISITSRLSPTAADATSVAAFALAEQQSANSAKQILLNAGLTTTRFVLTKDLFLTIDDVTTTGTVVSTTPDPLIVDPLSQYYLNYSVEEYLALKSENGEPMYLGDAGSTVTPLFDTSGNLRTFDVISWVVTSQSGVFVPTYFAVPEPTLALAATGLMLLRRRR